jgi:hypothetical protein
MSWISDVGYSRSSNMTKSLRNEQTEGVWKRKRMDGFPGDIFKIARRELGYLEDAVYLKDLDKIRLYHAAS